MIAWQAHATLPHLGAGAGCGIEDAYILAQLLAHSQTNAANVEVTTLFSLALVMKVLSISLLGRT